jgi:hypothetical protein
MSDINTNLEGVILTQHNSKGKDDISNIIVYKRIIIINAYNPKENIHGNIKSEITGGILILYQSEKNPMESYNLINYVIDNIDREKLKKKGITDIKIC